MKFNKTILLIHMEGMERFAQFMDEFEKRGFHIINVETIDEAYKVLATQTIDIIAIDLDLSYRDSFEFCYRIKRNENFKRIIILGFSYAHARFGIYLSTRTKEEKEWLNLDILVPKPISPYNVYRLIKKEIAIMEHLDSVNLDTSLDA